MMTEAKLLPPDKRVLFLERIEAVVRFAIAMCKQQSMKRWLG